jgi:hypothetical protein
LLGENMSLAQLKMLLTEPYFRDLYNFQKAIQKAENKSIASLLRLNKRIKSLGNIEIKPKPLLNGNDLMRLGAVAGPALGKLSRELYIAQLNNTIVTKEDAEEWVRNWLNKN